MRADRSLRARLRYLLASLVTFFVCALATLIVYLTVPEGVPADPAHAAGPEVRVPESPKPLVHMRPDAFGGRDGDARKGASAEDPKEVAEGSAVEAEATEGRGDAGPDEVLEPAALAFELQGDAREAVVRDASYAALTREIAAFERRGLTVAFVLHDVASGRELSYDADEELYPASSIKGPFTCCIYQELCESGRASLAEVEPVARVTILESSDEGYRRLHEMFGETAFVSWLRDAGVGPGSYDTYEQMVAWNYPHISARQLCLMWRHIYDYLTTRDSEASRQLATLFDEREVSSMRKAVHDEVRTWSKMGWFDSFSDYRSEPATVEAGTVFAKSGTYVFSVMTTAPAELDALIPLLSALDAAHDAFA